MMSDKRYQVVGACALFTQDAVTGPVKVHLYKGAVVAAGAKQDEIDHNLAVGLIAEIPTDGTPGVDAAGVPLVDDQRTVGEGEPGSPEQPPTPPAEESTSADQADSDVEARRAAARAKLPADGSAPDGRASEDVWREYAVAKGYDRATVEASSKDDIRALFK